MLPVRYVQCLLAFFLAFTSLFLRINLSVAIVAMTNSTSANPAFPQLDWDLRTRSDILSASSWGYMFMQVPAGQLGQLISAKQLLLWSSGVCGLLAMLTPIVAIQGGWLALYVLRLGQGACLGFYFPLIYKLASKWAPPEERNRFIGYALNGTTLGAVVSVAVSGLLASSSGGWPSVFYVSGVVGLSWTALWAWLGSDSPLAHPSITSEERDFLQTALVHSSEKNHPTPWFSIMTSTPVLALIAANLSSGWGITFVTTQIPTYLNSVLGLNIQANGLVSALTYFCPWVFTFPLCWMADYLISKKIMSVVAVRKIATTMSLGVSGAMMCTLSLVGRDRTSAIAILTLSVTISAFMFCGFFINHLDLSPNFAGVLMGVTNGLENIFSILATLSVGWLVSDATSADQWKSVFMTTALVAIVGNIVYIIFGSADLQEWNTPTEEKETRTREDSITSKHSVDSFSLKTTSP